MIIASVNKNVRSLAPVFGTTINVGDWITDENSGQNGVFVRVLSIIDSTHATTDSNTAGTHSSGFGSDKTGTLSISDNVATRISGSTWSTSDAGRYLVIAGQAYKIISATTTTFVLDAAPGNTSGVSYEGAGRLLYRSEAWSSDSCGALWVIKHHTYSNWVISGLKTDSRNNSFHSQYPDPVSFPATSVRGGASSKSAGEYAHNLTYTKAWGYLLSFLAVVDDDLNAQNRSQIQLTTLYDYWQDNIWGYAKQHWNGLTQSGSYYQMARAYQMIPATALAVRNSLLATPVDLVSGNWFKPSAANFYMGYNPSAPNEVVRWGQDSVSSAGISLVGLTSKCTCTRIRYRESRGSSASWASASIARQPAVTRSGTIRRPVATRPSRIILVICLSPHFAPIEAGRRHRGGISRRVRPTARATTARASTQGPRRRPQGVHRVLRPLRGAGEPGDAHRHGGADAGHGGAPDFDQAGDFGVHQVRPRGRPAGP